MDTVLFVNATIVFSENLFLVLKSNHMYIEGKGWCILTIIISATLMVWAKSFLVRLNPPNETVRSLQYSTTLIFLLNIKTNISSFTYTGMGAPLTQCAAVRT